MDESDIFEAGVTCWRIATAARVALIVDAAEYFTALASSFRKARRQIVIVAWDFDTRTPLHCDEGKETTLRDVLTDAMETHPELELRVLCWDSHLIYSFERQSDPTSSFPPHLRGRVHIEFDHKHPPGGSHHQKIVVVDGEVAYVGGLDITLGRWDTCDHKCAEPRRVGAHGKPYIPFHDTMFAVSGAAATALGDLASQRWTRQTGEELRILRSGADPWPESVEAEASSVPLALSRTEPGYLEQARILEIEALLLRIIAAARKLIYVENQYFCSLRIAEAIAARLDEADGPEVILILPKCYDGFVERHTIGARQAELVAFCEARDRHGRFLAASPMADARGGRRIHVHSKVMVADDRIFSIGSANLNARSLGFDSEANATIDALRGDRRELRAVVARMRDRLLAEHLGIGIAALRERVAERGGSVRAALLPFALEGRSLTPATDKVSSLGRKLAAMAVYVDPNTPSPYDHLDGSLNDLVPDSVEKRTSSPLSILTVLAIAIALLLLWRLTPLGGWLDLESLSRIGDSLWRHPLGPLLLMLALFAATTLMVPVNLLTAAMAIALDPWPAVCTTYVASMLSAVFTYAYGRKQGAAAVERLLGEKFRKLDLPRRLQHTGIVPIALIRLLPVAPFTIVNLVCGSCRIPFVSFAVGSAIALLPGKVASVIFAAQLKEWARGARSMPLTRITLIAVALGVAAVALHWLRLRWKHRHDGGHAVPRSSSSAKSGV